MITDKQRRAWLVAHGYTPKSTPVNNHLLLVNAKPDAEFVDWCLENKFCPAYWEPFDPLRHRQPSPNGMVFVKHGDRERIDQILREGIFAGWKKLGSQT